MRSLIAVVTVVLLTSTLTFAGPQEDLQRRAARVVTIAKELEGRSFQGQETPSEWTTKTHGEKLDEVRELIAEMLVIAQKHAIGGLRSQPTVRIWRPTDSQSLSAASQGNVGLDLEYVQRATGDTGFFPPQLDLAFLGVHNALYSYRSVVEVEGNFPLDISLRSFLFELSGDVEQFAINSQVRSAKSKALLAVLTAVPSELLASYNKQAEALQKEAWRFIDARDLEKTRANFRKAKALFVEIQTVFLNPKFQALEGASSVFGQKKEQARYGGSDALVPDFTKPRAAQEMLRSFQILGQVINQNSTPETPKLHAEWATLMFELNVMLQTGSPLSILTALRSGTNEGITKALAFFEPSGQEKAQYTHEILLGREVAELGIHRAPLFKDFFFPLILKVALGSSGHLADKAKRILKRWSQENVIKPEWIVSRLKELGKSQKPRLGYASVNAEAKDLFDYYYEPNNLGQGALRELYFDGIGELSAEYPNLLGNYLAENEGKVYIHEVIAKRQHLSVLTEGVRLAILKIFFPNLPDKTKVENRIDPRDFEAALKMDIFSIDDLMKLRLHTENDEFYLKISNLLDLKINAVQGSAERHKLRLSALGLDLDSPTFCSDAAAGRRPKTNRW